MVCGTMSAAASRFLSPVAVARLLGDRNSKVTTWIRTCELKASNLATRPGTRPRYRISPEALEAFLSGRKVIPPAKPVRRVKGYDDVIEYF